MLEDLQCPKFSVPLAAPSDKPALGEGPGDSGKEANKPHPIAVEVAVQLPDVRIHHEARNPSEFGLLGFLCVMGLCVGANAQVKCARSGKFSEMATQGK